MTFPSKWCISHQKVMQETQAIHFLITTLFPFLDSPYKHAGSENVVVSKWLDSMGIISVDIFHAK